MSNNYDNNSIKVLKGLEPVRTRPGMYIGSTGPEGLHHMIWEIVDNSIDEAMAGFATTVKLIIKSDGSISVEDDGRGIPIEIHNETKKSTVETVLTVLHAGGKFDNDSYKVSGGLHGVGASVVNALSEWFKVWVSKENKEYFIEFKNGGAPVDELKLIGSSEKKNGTKIQFYPDFTIMEESPWDEDKIINRLKELAYLNKGVNIEFTSELTNRNFKWCFNGGLLQYVQEINEQKEPLYDEIIYGDKTEIVQAITGNEKIGISKIDYSIRCEFAFQYNKTYNSSIHTFCNNINTSEGGTHEEGFSLALVRIINNYAIEKKWIKDPNKEKVNKEDVLEGLTAIISIKHPNPQYEGQTKKKLGNSEVRKFVNNVVSELFEKFLLENPNLAEIIIKKIQAAAETRKRSQEFKEATRRKSPFESNSLPGKLADCSSRDASVTELYLVEGDSAGGSAKTGREREFQAILPLKGKILNVEKSNSSKVFSTNEIIDIITAIGCGTMSDYNPEKLRYNKIIIMTDADVDGAHIRILLLTFFFRYMKNLINDGNIYIAQPPLYKFTAGKTIKYAYNEEELERYKAEVPSGRYNIQRYKGLGEMNPEQLWETTMNPENRILLKVTIDDAIKADQWFSLLMGDDVPPRKKFIEENAEYVKNIDA
ncbi:MAG: DNA topoisomerase (ATP-hydrolyzing) subunit B [Ureaplasma sp.]|nr:DNA topoisomerase (ATP-hydrolyzing) subunit B [Ureaplasma sp.]MDE7221932.1 DNA topoisomerase (ATP-hydrolyzing) subunit B [Ureaplasma sp.]